MTKNNMANLFIVFNHKLTEKQFLDARTTLDVDNFITLPDHLDNLWRQIPPELDVLSKYLSPLTDWLRVQSSKNDYILIQGEFGATYHLVNWSFKHDLIPIYSTTRRNALEEHLDDGSVTIHHIFDHVKFRKYK